LPHLARHDDERERGRSREPASRPRDRATISEERFACGSVSAERRSTLKQSLADTIAILSRTPAVLNALLRGLPDACTLRNEGKDTWNAFEVVGHLIHGERTDWMPRAKRMIESGESRPFEAFDRRAQERENEGRSLIELLDEFARLRSDNLAELRGMDLRPEDLGRRGRHPALGVVTLSQLLATWGAHDLTHLHQISRILAHPYREAVGPWSVYLGVLQCAGHSR